MSGPAPSGRCWSPRAPKPDRRAVPSLRPASLGPVRRLEGLGFWFHELAPDDLPLPQRLVGRWRASERTAVLAWLRGGRRVVRYPTASWCRFACGARAMGRSDLTDGTFVWPEGLAHYVERHRVRLPSRFVAHVLARAGERPRFRVPAPRFGLYDLAPWRRWARAAGACLDLRGWRRPDAVAAARIAAALGLADGDVVVLVGSRPRRAVVHRLGGPLVVHALAGANRPRRLAGWHRWPAR